MRQLGLSVLIKIRLILLLRGQIVVFYIENYFERAEIRDDACGPVEHWSSLLSHGGNILPIQPGRMGSITVI